MTIADHLVASGDNTAAGERFTLARIGDEDWLIHDTTYPENDARHLVACVRERGLDHVDVIWLQGKGLATKFARVSDVLDTARRSLGRRIPTAPAARPENWLG
ncbi:hypothetical protein ACIQLJ_14170 [Microbacterium sp. NPDC091313]